MASDDGVKQWTSLIVSYTTMEDSSGRIADVILAEMGLLFCRRVSREWRGYPRAHRTYSFHPSHALRYVS